MATVLFRPIQCQACQRMEGNTAAVNGTYIRLSKGHTVTLGHCTEKASWNMSSYDSTFSGLLITPDAGL